MGQPVIVIITITAYCVLLMAVSYFASRGSDNTTLLHSNRKTPWPVVAFAVKDAISGVTFISVPGMVMGKETMPTTNGARLHRGLCGDSLPACAAVL